MLNLLVICLQLNLHSCNNALLRELLSSSAQILYSKYILNYTLAVICNVLNTLVLQVFSKFYIVFLYI